jgi:hypothetical protein
MKKILNFYSNLNRLVKNNFIFFFRNAYYSFINLCHENKKNFIDVIRMFAPGTSLRSALDDLLRCRMGALIVFKTPELDSLMEGDLVLLMQI